jgi:hypothetical protein
MLLRLKKVEVCMQALKVAAVMVAVAGGVTMFSTGSGSTMPLMASAAAITSALQTASHSLVIDVQYRRFRPYRGARYVRRDNGATAAIIIGGMIIGAIIASEVARQSYYYDGGVAYCMQRFRSYDPYSRTYLGYDGYRHPCP